MRIGQQARRLLSIVGEVRAVCEGFFRDMERERWASLYLRELQGPDVCDEPRIDSMRTVVDAAGPRRLKRKRQAGSPSWARRKKEGGDR